MKIEMKRVSIWKKGHVNVIFVRHTLGVPISTQANIAKRKCLTIVKVAFILSRSLDLNRKAPFISGLKNFRIKLPTHTCITVSGPHQLVKSNGAKKYQAQNLINMVLV
jgi:hypothetical protein